MWDWVPNSRGHCSAEFQIMLLKRLKRILPPNCLVSKRVGGQLALQEYKAILEWERIGR